MKHGQKVVYVKSCPHCQTGDVEIVKHWKMITMMCVQCGWTLEGVEKK